MSTEAMKLALEALESKYIVNCGAWRVQQDQAITVIREALASEAIEQPAQQEPVAWVNPNDLQNFDMKVRTNGGPLHTVPLYTSPPARKPLTDEIPSPDELEALSDGNSGMIFNAGFPTKLDKLACWLREYAAIEAAHGIKEK